MRTLLFVGVLVSSSFGAAAEDWPQWRGPNRDGISTEKAWSPAGQAEALWTKQVGLGYSTMSITDGRLYTIGFDGEAGRDVVLCLDALSGEELWRHTYPANKMAKFHGGGSLTTPSVEGNDVYVFSREGKYTQLDAKTGEERWTIDLEDEYDLTRPTWGFAASPLILDDMIVVHGGKVMAFEKGKTKLRWISEDYGHAYSTPSDCTLKGRDCLAVMGGKQFVLLDRKGGKQLATFPWETKYDVNAASPVVIDDERVWISSGYGHGGAMLRFDGEKVEQLWFTRDMKNQMSTSVLIGGHLYGLDEAVLKCFDLEGKELWRQRGMGKGALSAAGDRLLIHTGRGELAVVKSDPQQYQELARLPATDGGVCWTMPILVNGVIYLRSSQGELVARDHRLGN
jgi:outer membrane protein assembly factor BamB